MTPELHQNHRQKKEFFKDINSQGWGTSERKYSRNMKAATEMDK